MKTIFWISWLVLALSSCRLPTDMFEADVRLEKAFAAADVAESRTLLYRVVSPPKLAGRYGVAMTRASAAKVQSNVGVVYRIRLTEKDGQMLTVAEPNGGSTSSKEDFFTHAIRVKE
jgi:hypothetical protein